MTKKTKVVILSILNVGLIILIGYMYRWRFSITTLAEDHCKAFNVKDCRISTIINDDFRHKLVVIETDTHYSSISVESLGFVHRQIAYEDNIKIPFVDNSVFEWTMGTRWFSKEDSFIIDRYLNNPSSVSFYQSDDASPRLEDVVFETEEGTDPLIKINRVFASKNKDHIFTYNGGKRYLDQDKALLYYRLQDSEKSLKIFDYGYFLSEGNYLEVHDSKDNMLKHHFIEENHTEENEKLMLLSSLHALKGSMKNVDVDFIKENYDFTIISKNYKYNEDTSEQSHELDSNYTKYYFKSIEGGALIIETDVINDREYNNAILGIIDAEYHRLKENIGFVSE